MQAGSARAANPAPLVELARHCVVPDDMVSTRYWELVAPELPGMGVALDQWQQDEWELALSLRADGSLCCDVMGVTLSIARQSGKTWGVMIGLIAICLRRPGTTVVWSSHHDRTSSETLTKIAGIVERPEIRPKMKARNPVVMTDDSRGVHFANGSRMLFGARSAGFGRGFSEVDIQVYDECQFLLESALTDMLAAMNVSDIGLAFFMGTPPRPKEVRLGVDEAFRRRRTRATDPGRKRAYKGVYIEFGADADAPLDIEAAGFWDHLARANPAYGFRVGNSAIERLVENMAPDDVSREVLGRWDELEAQFSPFNGELWADAVDIGPADDAKPIGFGVEMSHDRQVSISACWVADEGAHIEEVLAGYDEATAVTWLTRAWRAAGRRTTVIIDSYSPAASMVPVLRARGVRVHVGSASDMARACGLTLSDLESGVLTHADQGRLDAARRDARKRLIGTAGGWGLDRGSEQVRVAPMVSAVLARLAAALIRQPTGAGRTSTGRKVVTRG